MSSKHIAVFSLQAAKELIRQGFVVKNVSNNRYKAHSLVFYFDDTEATRAILAKQGIIIKE